jgi:hypothetical protein
MMGDDAGGAAPAAGNAVSAYEAKRMQRIQQNQQMLQSLGIAVQPRERKRRIVTRDDNAVPVEPRRSSRLQQQPTEQEPPLELDSTPRHVRMRRVRGTEFTPLKLPSVEATRQRPTGKLSRQSSTLLDMDMAAFHDRWLGKQIWPKGKATVMEGMCPMHVPSFSKMLGIQQWRNGVVLFVNVHGASGYENSFTEVPRKAPSSDSTEPTAVHFRWFAQERQHEASPAVVRLMAAQHGDRSLWLDGAASQPPPESDQSGMATKPEPVLLFLRHVDGPYVYCGRLAYLGHLRDSKPMEFRWQLLDLDKIQWRDVKHLIDAAADHVHAEGVAAEMAETMKTE